MRIVVDVLRAEQSWDLASHQQQNYLVIEVFGVETRVPCSEEELVHALCEAQVATPASAEERDHYDDENEELPFVPPDEEIPVAAPATFVGAAAPDSGALPPEAPARRRKLAPVRRARGDDAGIAQG